MFSLEQVQKTKSSPVPRLEIVPPDIDHGGDMWRIAKESGQLDLNTSYMYLLFARDFAETCRVALHNGEVVAFVLGYRRPENEDCLFIWQVAVDENSRSGGIAGKMLDDLVQASQLEGKPIRTIETTVTDDNIPSRRLFSRFADRWDAELNTRALFQEDIFPDEHEAERLHKIGPIDPNWVPKVPTKTTPSKEASAAMSVTENPETQLFDSLESQVRGYSRSWPVVFDRAVGSCVYDEAGNEYLDFFSGAGSLNYGHNNPMLKDVLIRYITEDRMIHSLDMFTTARRDFLTTFKEVILEPRGLDYKVMFPGPGGTNAVEAALKLARKVTGRESIVNFTNAFHGMTLGALSVTGDSLKRGGAGVPLVHTTPMPYDDYFNQDYPDFFYFKRLLEDSGSGFNLPAAVIVESVQGEGGVNAARKEWLQGLAELCRENDILLILDDVQMGCGRTGAFFSFEEAGIVPDIVCLSKSISASGLPLALTLMRPELDIWEPGEHNGTFRGIALAFETATAAIREYWQDSELSNSTVRKGLRVESRFNQIASKYADSDTDLTPKGRGLARGLEFPNGELAGKVCQIAFERGLLMETSGPNGEVMKVLPALTISDDELGRGLDIIDEAVATVLGTPAA